MKKAVLMMVAVMMAAVCFAQDYPVRTWTLKSGMTVEGRFVKRFTAKNGAECVMIKKTDGKDFGPLASQFSDEDQAYIKSITE